MRNGTYAVYKGKEFSASYLSKGNFLLISKDIKDLKYGFSPSPRNKGYYVKTVAQSDLDEVFKIRPKAIYKGDEFGVEEVRNHNGIEIAGRILLITTNRKIGAKHDFGMPEFGVYTKEVGLDEVDKLFEIKKPYPTD